MVRQACIELSLTLSAPKIFLSQRHGCQLYFYHNVIGADYFYITSFFVNMDYYINFRVVTKPFRLCISGIIKYINSNVSPHLANMIYLLDSFVNSLKTQFFVVCIGTFISISCFMLSL